MSYRTGPKGIGVLAAALALGAPLTASAHAYVMTPPSRDVGIVDLNARAHKTGPCGGSPRIGSPTKFAPGAQVLVKWEETIQHTGCFQIRFSNNNDMNFTLLNLQAGGPAQINDPSNNAIPMVFQATVTLPTTKCPACTLQVLQLMKGSACVTNENPVSAAFSTYYSCADICIGDAADPCTDAPKPDAGAEAGTDSGTSSSSSSSSGSTTDSGTSSSSSGGDAGKTTSSSSGVGPSREPADSDGGCAVSDSGSPGGLSLAAIAGFLGFALVRRRRSR